MHYKHGCTEKGKRNSRHPEWRSYCAWSGMIARCQNETRADYALWGGRGITVCERWQDFANFFHDMGAPPLGATIDRIDNNGNYEPSNCTWASRKEQARNRRSNRILEYNGLKMSVTEWAEHLNVPRQRLKNRVHRGWPVERILGAD